MKGGCYHDPIRTNDGFLFGCFFSRNPLKLMKIRYFVNHTVIKQQSSWALTGFVKLNSVNEKDTWMQCCHGAFYTSWSVMSWLWGLTQQCSALWKNLSPDAKQLNILPTSLHTSTLWCPRANSTCGMCGDAGVSGYIGPYKRHRALK